MHGMLIQMVVVLLPVALADFVIIPHHIVHHRPHVFIIPQGKVAVIGIHKNLRLQRGIFCLVNIDTDFPLVKGRVPPVKILQGILYRAENMLFSLLLRHTIPGNGILQPSKLGTGVAPEGFGRPLGKENPFIFQKLPSQGI